MAGAYQGGQELIGIGCLLMLRLSRLTSCCLLVVGCWLVVGFRRMVFRELFSEKRMASRFLVLMCVCVAMVKWVCVFRRRGSRRGRRGSRRGRRGSRRG